MSGKVYGLPGMGIMPRTVGANAKCEGCFHYDSKTGQSGLCMVGLQPTSCGDGEDPNNGYAPVTLGKIPPDFGDPLRTQARKDNHLLRTDPEGSQTLKLETTPLTDEHIGLVKSIVAEMLPSTQQDCLLHNRPSGVFFGVVDPTRGFTQCNCETIDPRRVAKAFFARLPNRVKHGKTKDEIQEFVLRAMSRVYASPVASKKPPSQYLPGVHDPNHPLRPKRGVSKKPGSSSRDKSLASEEQVEKAEAGITAIEDLLFSEG